MSFKKTFLRDYRALSEAGRRELVGGLSADQIQVLNTYWPLWARSDQLAPDGDWLTWFVLGGRGAGKTRTGAEWVRGLALGQLPAAHVSTSPIALIGETMQAVREVMVEGVSGVLAVHPPGERPNWIPSRNRLEWKNGAVAQLYSAQDPDGLRGPQFAAAWCDEFGCPAIDKGSNQPNVFYDPKSSESQVPYFSNGESDGLIQNQFLQAHLRYWDPTDLQFNPANNPVSSVYNAPMVDHEYMFAWAWDARPYPAFPSLVDVWSDGGNWATGHWLSGRTGGVNMGEVLAAMSADFGLTNMTIETPGPLIDGYVVDEITSYRRAAEPLIEAGGLLMHAREQNVVVRKPGFKAQLGLYDADLVEPQTGAALINKRQETRDAPARYILGYQDRNKDYQAHIATSVHEAANSDRSKSLNSTIVTGLSTAFGIAHDLLSRAQATLNGVQFGVGSANLALEPGDVISLSNGDESQFMITQLERAETAQIEAIVHEAKPLGLQKPQNLNEFSSVSEPGDIVGTAFVLPTGSTNQTRAKLHIGGFSSPWPGRLLIYNEVDGAHTQIGNIDNPAQIGTIATALNAKKHQYFDDVTRLDVVMHDGHLASIGDLELLNGGNRAAIRSQSGAYEIIQFGNAELVGDKTYRLSHLLRGVDGTIAASMDGAEVGAPFVLLNEALFSAELDVDQTGIDLQFSLAQENDLADGPFATSLTARAYTDRLSSLPPAHPFALPADTGADINIGWTRQSRQSGQSWVPLNVPLDDTSLQFELSILDMGNVVRTVQTDQTHFVYTEAMQIADFGSAPTQFDFEVRQINTIYGAGQVAQGRFDG